MPQTVNIKLDFNQLLLMVKQCDYKQKLAIVKELDKETYKVRFKQLLSKLKNNKFTDDEIIKEVELVREKRYTSKEKK
jgi:hypothetical protein